MKELIEGLLKDERLDGLMVTREFATARFRLLTMLKTLDSGKKLSKEQLAYLHGVEKHIKNIHPHIEILQVGGEDVPVAFITDKQ